MERMALEVRDAKLEDLPAIVEIYNASIPGRLATADLDPVPVESKVPWFNEHQPGKRPLWVAVHEGEICAWLSYQSFYGRPAYDHTAEISVYVSPKYQRKGIGRTLLQKAIQQAPKFGLSTLLGFIFGHNMPSRNLFSEFGFKPWANLPRIAVLDGIERDLTIVGLRVSE
jgi:phosphinothricin acetyltransferase